ncbi:hypothetical protein SRABI128_05132 [Microbacterium sp. Bi128]|nr:hypothetical protein SRABI128_05132 [Microbacterium sp. Bi128]
MAPFGGPGTKPIFQPISAGVWSLLALLHRRHAATRFSQESAPPRDLGWMWSMVWAALPQYAQRWASRRSTPRRLTAVIVLYLGRM